MTNLIFCRTVAGLACLSVASAVHAANPSSHALTVHEWGVEEFDWSKPGQSAPEDLPPFLYTDQKPGLPIPDAGLGRHVRDQRPGDGRSYPMRAKPILYFYGHGPVDVELRFAQGHAIAWWPQATIYRTPEQTQKAQAPDWTAWWREQAKLQRGFTQFPGKQPVPMDERCDLVWNNLALGVTPPEGIAPKGGDLPASHWIRRARLEEIPSEHGGSNDMPIPRWVSNGREIERYLFYEGREPGTTPAIMLVPAREAHCRMESSFDEKPSLALVNVSARTIHDVIVIYRDTAKQIRWRTHVPTLAPQFKKQDNGWFSESYEDTRPRFIRIPDPSKMTADADEPFFHRVLREQALAAMTDPTGASNTERWGTFELDRDPAIPGRTFGGTLFPAEAKALLDIWDKEFFTQEGLTILYRESPEALDAAMPLHIFTTIGEEAQLQRVGWVLNHHVPMHQEVAGAFAQAQTALAEPLKTASTFKTADSPTVGNGIRDEARAWLHRQKADATLKAGAVDWLLMDHGLPPLRVDLPDAQPPTKAPCEESASLDSAFPDSHLLSLPAQEPQEHNWRRTAAIALLNLLLIVLLTSLWRRKRRSAKD